MHTHLLSSDAQKWLKSAFLNGVAQIHYPARRNENRRQIESVRGMRKQMNIYAWVQRHMKSQTFYCIVDKHEVYAIMYLARLPVVEGVPKRV